MCDMKRIDPPGDHSRHFLQTYVQYEILLWLGCVGRRNTSSLTLSLLNLLRPCWDLASCLLSWLAPLTLTLCLPRFDIQPVSLNSRMLASTKGTPVLPSAHASNFALS